MKHIIRGNTIYYFDIFLKDISRLKYFVLLISQLLGYEFAFTQNSKTTFQSEKKSFYYGYVFDENGNAIQGVNIFQVVNSDTTLSTFTDEFGFYQIHNDQNINGLEYYLLGFDTEYVELNDSIYYRSGINIELKQKTYSLPEITITIDKIEKIINNDKVWLFDYLVSNEGILLLGKDSRSSFLLRINFFGDTIAETKHHFKAEQLFQDGLNNQYIITKDSMIQIYEINDSLMLMKGIDNKEFAKKIKPIIAVNDSVVILRQTYKFNQEIDYTLFYRKLKEHKPLKRISNSEQLSIILDFLQEQMGFEGKHDISDSAELYSYRDSFKENIIFNHLYAQPIYCPLFKVNSGFVLFDLINDSINIYNYNGEILNKVDITFHRSKFFRKIHYDEAQDLFYSEFYKKGIVNLSKIDIETGLIRGSQEIKLDFLFPEDISVYNGKAYFLYRKRYASFGDYKTIYYLPIAL